MTSTDLAYGDLTRSIIGAFFEVYNQLGYGFLEHVYVRALELELRSRGHQVIRQLSVSVAYKGHEIATQRLDMVVDGCVVVEVKSTSLLAPSATRQIYSYLRSTNLDVGLVLHFGPEKPAFKRVFCDAHHKAGRSVASVTSVQSVPPSS